MKKTAILVAAAILIGSMSFAQATTEESEQVKVKGPFKETWVRPDADISQYSKIYPWKAVFQFREEGDKGAPTTAGKLRGDDGPFAVNEESKQKFEEIVNSAFVKELGRSKIFELVDEVGPDTLLVRAMVVDIVSNVPPSFTGTADIHLSSVGEATFLFELIDSETGEVQATVGERRLIQPPGRMNDVSAAPANSATVYSDIERWANSVARDLRTTLEKAHKKATK